MRRSGFLRQPGFGFARQNLEEILQACGSLHLQTLVLGLFGSEYSQVEPHQLVAWRTFVFVDDRVRVLLICKIPFLASCIMSKSFCCSSTGTSTRTTNRYRMRHRKCCCCCCCCCNGKLLLCHAALALLIALQSRYISVSLHKSALQD